MQYTKLRENIWQIADEHGVYCTLVKGTRLAVLWDTGYGNLPLTEFVEQHVHTEYLVINSHGHPDHIGGNKHFQTVYACPDEFDVIRRNTIESTGSEPSYTLKPLEIGQVLELGNLQGEVVSLAGHTKGSIGLLFRSQRLLLAGDAMNPCLWLFHYGALSVRQLRDTLERTDQLPFDTYSCGHSDRELPHAMIQAILANIRTMRLDRQTKKILMGAETYESIYEGKEGRSSIVFAEELLDV